MDYCIVYTSSVTSLLSSAELDKIRYQSQLKNQSMDITGILLYFNGCLIEVLEGPEKSVKELFKKISHDPRHSQLIQLYASPIRKRSFPGWFMGYKSLSSSEFEQIRAIIPFVNNPAADIDAQQENVIITLVQLFYKNNYRN